MKWDFINKGEDTFETPNTFHVFISKNLLKDFFETTKFTHTLYNYNKIQYISIKINSTIKKTRMESLF